MLSLRLIEEVGEAHICTLYVGLSTPFQEGE
jgi:hypothetical protein